MSDNPFSIPIGTSDPVNLCQGLPLFPLLGTARAGASATERSYRLLDVSATVLITRLKVSCYASAGFGVCGPAIAFLSRNVSVDRTNSDNENKLTLTFNEGLLMEAGAFMGAYVGGGLTLTLQVYLPKPWYKVWSFGWTDAFAVDLNYTVDLLEILVLLIRYLMSQDHSKSIFEQDPQNRLEKTLATRVKTYSLVDTAGSSNSVQPDLTATPAYTIPFNLINAIPKLKAVNAGLAKVGGEISAGPSLHIQFPVTFNFDKFTVVGGLNGPSSADYGNVEYLNDNQVSATGGTKFDTDKTPSRVTTHVTYETSFKVALSFHFAVTVAKLFSFQVNTPSLNLLYLLYNIPEVPGVPIPNSVSTSVEGGCVLTPNMTLTFLGPNGSGTNFPTGALVKGVVTLPGYVSSNPATVALEIEPPVAGFPGSVTIPAGAQQDAFYFTFQNRCLATGNPNNPSETAPPSPISPIKTYTVSAKLSKLQSASNNPCSDYEVEAPLNITERFIRCQAPALLYKPAPAPPWDPLAGAGINADMSLPPKNIGFVAGATCWFPYLASEPTATVPVTITLLDENRQPYSGSNVTLSLNGKSFPLKPSVTGMVTLQRSRGTVTFSVLWLSKGPYTGYSNRFYLIVNAGCQYGQTEYWLDVWNWS
jgi:hypothetical protein